MPGAAAEITARNLVLRGDGSDIHIDPDGTYTPFTPGNPICISLPEMCVPMPIYAAKLTLTNSNFRTISGAALAPGSTANGSADPGFIDAAAGNFRAAPGSPLIDAGAADPENGATDLDGQARTQGSAPDIGAYETAGGAPPDPGGGSMVPPPPDPQTMPLDDAAPTLSALRIGNSRFRVGRQATPVAAGSTRRRAPLGTTFRFTSSEQATATVQISRGAAGRRRGRSCVKPTRRLRKAKKCTRYVPVGMLSRPAMIGANSVPFSGRIGSKALKPGPYMVGISARDIVGNPTLRSLAGRFRIVRR